MPDRPARLTRHTDHDPGLICRPALGIGLCEVLETCGSEEEGQEPASGERRA